MVICSFAGSVQTAAFSFVLPVKGFSFTFSDEKGAPLALTTVCPLSAGRREAVLSEFQVLLA